MTQQAPAPQFFGPFAGVVLTDTIDSCGTEEPAILLRCVDEWCEYPYEDSSERFDQLRNAREHAVDAAARLGQQIMDRTDAVADDVRRPVERMG